MHQASVVLDVGGGDGDCHPQVASRGVDALDFVAGATAEPVVEDCSAESVVVHAVAAVLLVVPTRL